MKNQYKPVSHLWNIYNYPAQKSLKYNHVITTTLVQRPTRVPNVNGQVCLDIVWEWCNPPSLLLRSLSVVFNKHNDSSITPTAVPSLECVFFNHPSRSSILMSYKENKEIINTSLRYTIDLKKNLRIDTATDDYDSKYNYMWKKN